MSPKNKGFLFVKFLLPSALWLFLFRAFLNGKAVIFSEDFMIYSIVKSYLDNLRLGVVPLWDPYISWGVINTIILAHIGPFNPLWLLVLLLNVLGVSFYHAYLVGIGLYFFAGLAGFFLLAKTVLKNELAAYAAFLLLLFSSLSMPLAGQLMPLFLFVPGVWFFFFGVRFCECFEKKYFIGLVFSTMMVVSTYLPLYFLTVFLLALFLGLIIYPGHIWQTIKGWGQFLRRNALLAIISLGLITLFLMPAAQAYLSTIHKEVVAPERHGGQAETFTEGVELNGYFSDGDLSARMSFEDLYAHLDQIQYANDGFFYISLFAFILLAFGTFNKISRIMIYLAFFTLTLFLLTITNATPLHRFLFDHVFYFRLFRNMHYLLPYLLSALILFVGYQLKMFLEEEGWRRVPFKPALAVIVFVHLGCAAFLLSQDYIIISSYVTVAVSILFFILLLARRPKAGNTAVSCGASAGAHESNQLLLAAVMFFCVVIQPVEVFWHFNTNNGSSIRNIVKECLRSETVRPRFYYVRPAVKTAFASSGEFLDYFQAFRMQVKDDPGFIVPTKAFPSFWSFFVSQKIPEDAFRSYSHNKFYLYDNIKLTGEQGPTDEITNIFRENKNLALVHLEGNLPPADLESFSRRPAYQDTKEATVIPGPGADLEVIAFDANSIKLRTDFSANKFLIYTDSYHSSWQAFVNGRRVGLYRANLAFKGLLLPAGRNIVLLRFHPAGGTAVYFLTYLISLSLFVYLIILFGARYPKARIINGCGHL